MNRAQTGDTPDVVMYTQMLCGYCAAARALLDEKGVSYREIDVTLRRDHREEMIKRSEQRTVPQVFIGERHIGGYDELAALESDGELDKLLGLT